MDGSEKTQSAFSGKLKSCKSCPKTKKEKSKLNLWSMKKRMSEGEGSVVI
jgi:hypothetical protein